MPELGLSLASLCYPIAAKIMRGGPSTKMLAMSDVFQVVSSERQVVASTNFIKVDAGEGTYEHPRVFEPPPSMKTSL